MLSSIRILLFAGMLLTALQCFSAVWQYHIPAKRGAAFLWIPENCDKVRGVIIAQQVILDKVTLEDPAIRQAAREQSLAIMILNRVDGVGGDFFHPETPGKSLDDLLAGFARLSGYPELAKAPYLTLGHSGGAIFAWHAAYADPARAIGVIGLKSAPIPPPREKPQANVDGVPVLDISGQYETWDKSARPAEHHWKWVRAHLLADRGFRDRALMSEIVEPGATHFGWTPELAQYVADFIRKAAASRIAPDGTLRTIPLESGWLTDCTLLSPPRYPAAPYSKFQGEPELAFWHLDGDLAKRSESFALSGRAKLQELSFVNNGKLMEREWLNTLDFLPEEDGMTVRVKAGFLKRGTPRVAGKNTILGHAPGEIRFRLIGGWSGGGEQIGPDRFRLRRDRFSFRKPADNLMVMAWHPGGAGYCYTEQPAQIKYPAEIRDGAVQTIRFDLPEKLPADTRSFPLRAESSAGLPVEFFVLSGPAEIENGNTLIIREIPRKSVSAPAVTVVAVQRGVPGKVRTAPDVIRTVRLSDSFELRDAEIGDPRLPHVRKIPIGLLQNSPAGADGKQLPCFVWIHGGAWVSGDASSGLPQLRYFARRGMIGVSLDYRLIGKPGTPEFTSGPTLDDAVADCREAIRYLRRNARNLGIDPNRIAVAGDSAGGHLALMLAVSAPDARPNFIAACNPISEIDSDWNRFTRDEAMAERNSPLHQIPKEKSLPPLLLLHGRADTVVPFAHSSRFAAAWPAAELKLYEHALHAFACSGYTASDAEVIRAWRDMDAALVRHGFLDKSADLCPTSARTGEKILLPDLNSNGKVLRVPLPAPAGQWQKISLEFQSSSPEGVVFSRSHAPLSGELGFKQKKFGVRCRRFNLEFPANVFKPNAWNRVELTVRPDVVRLEFNGQVMSSSNPAQAGLKGDELLLGDRFRGKIRNLEIINLQP